MNVMHSKYILTMYKWDDAFPLAIKSCILFICVLMGENCPMLVKTPRVLRDSSTVIGW
jgi:hypothetical protein